MQVESECIEKSAQRISEKIHILQRRLAKKPTITESSLALQNQRMKADALRDLLLP
jgi:hypothetical protein